MPAKHRSVINLGRPTVSPTPALGLCTSFSSFPLISLLDQERRSRHAQVQERGQTSMYQNSNVIKAAAAAARTNVTREIRQELKATDPDRSRGTDVESSSIVDGGTCTCPGTAAARTCTTDFN